MIKSAILMLTFKHHHFTGNPDDLHFSEFLFLASQTNRKAMCALVYAFLCVRLEVVSIRNNQQDQKCSKREKAILKVLLCQTTLLSRLHPVGRHWLDTVISTQSQSPTESGSTYLQFLHIRNAMLVSPERKSVLHKPHLRTGGQK